MFIHFSMRYISVALCQYFLFHKQLSWNFPKLVNNNKNLLLYYLIFLVFFKATFRSASESSLTELLKTPYFHLHSNQIETFFNTTTLVSPTNVIATSFHTRIPTYIFTRRSIDIFTTLSKKATSKARLTLRSISQCFYSSFLNTRQFSFHFEKIVGIGGHFFPS